MPKVVNPIEKQHLAFFSKKFNLLEILNPVPRGVFFIFNYHSGRVNWAGLRTDQQSYYLIIFYSGHTKKLTFRTRPTSTFSILGPEFTIINILLTGHIDEKNVGDWEMWLFYSEINEFDCYAVRTKIVD